MILYENHLGTIDVSKDYLIKLVSKAVKGCFGVVGISARKSAIPTPKWVKLGSGEAGGVKITYNKKKLDVELHILASYGVNLTEMVRSIVNKVRYTLEETVGCQVAHVAVYVDGMKL